MCVRLAQTLAVKQGGKMLRRRPSYLPQGQATRQRNLPHTKRLPARSGQARELMGSLTQLVR